MKIWKNKIPQSMYDEVKKNLYAISEFFFLGFHIFLKCDFEASWLYKNIVSFLQHAARGSLKHNFSIVK